MCFRRVYYPQCHFHAAYMKQGQKIFNFHVRVWSTSSVKWDSLGGYYRFQYLIKLLIIRHKINQIKKHESQDLFVTLEEISVCYINGVGRGALEMKIISWNVTIQVTDLDQNTKKH